MLTWTVIPDASAIESNQPPQTRDGLYARLALGAGVGAVTTRADYGDFDWSADYRGVGTTFDLLVGGSIGSWLVVGGGLSLSVLHTLQVEASSPRALEQAHDRNNLWLGMLGPFVDVFQGTDAGAHLGAMVGVARIGLEDDAGASSGGWGVGVFGGYDAWLARDWAAGVALQYSFVCASRELERPNPTTAPGNVIVTTHDTGSALALLVNLTYE